MCVLICLRVFAWLICGTYIYSYIYLIPHTHKPVLPRGASCARKANSARGNRLSSRFNSSLSPSKAGAAEALKNRLQGLNLKFTPALPRRRARKRTRHGIMGSGPNGCFTPRTYQHVNLGVAGIVLYPIALGHLLVDLRPDHGLLLARLRHGLRPHDDHDRDVRFVRDPLGHERLGRDAPARVDLPRDLRRVRRIRHSRRDPGHRPGPGVALDTRVRGTLPTPQYVPAAAPPLPLNV